MRQQNSLGGSQLTGFRQSQPHSRAMSDVDVSESLIQIGVSNQATQAKSSF